MISPENSPIFLIGYMAAGKSTLGRALAAARPALRFIDLDAEVEAVAGRSIAEIFAVDGEQAFRNLETDVLRRVAAPGTIIACGGGTPCRTENMDFMLSAGRVIWLRANIDITLQRLLEAPAGSRPLVDSLRADPAALRERALTMQRERAPHYSRATAEFDSSRLDTVEQVAESVDIFLNRFIDSHN
ncbi:MAG: shikimate kinase [Bacteroidales bacterium]|nr:shikimate kinase [Bacteroidales bacterium]